MTFDGAGSFAPDSYAGRNLHFGVREHAAGRVSNGPSLSKVRPYQAGFLIFYDFQPGAIRLSALMEIPVVHIYTHDSIGVGEDGPTHPAPVDRVIRRVRNSQVSPALILAHGHLLRVLAARWLEQAPEEAVRCRLDTATISVLGWERDTRVILRLNT